MHPKKFCSGNWFFWFFCKQAIDFHSTFKILCHTSKLENFVKITDPYCWPWRSKSKIQRKQRWKDDVCLLFYLLSIIQKAKHIKLTLVPALILSIFSILVSNIGGGGTKSSCFGNLDSVYTVYYYSIIIKNKTFLNRPSLFQFPKMMSQEIISNHVALKVRKNRFPKIPYRYMQCKYIRQKILIFVCEKKEQNSQNFRKTYITKNH